MRGGKATIASVGSWKQRVFALVLGLCLPLFLIECSLQLFPSLVPAPVLFTLSNQETSLIQDHPLVGRTYRPGLDRWLSSHPDFSYRIKTCDLGFAGAGFRDDGIDGEAWAVAVGDSFTAGWGVDDDESWPERLEQATGRDVVNLGIPGLCTLENEKVLEHFGLRLHPELVLFAIYPNDHSDNLTHLGEQAQQRLLRTAIKQALSTETLGSRSSSKGSPDFGLSCWIAPLPQVEVPQPVAILKAGEPSASDWQVGKDFSIIARFEVFGAQGFRPPLFLAQHSEAQVILRMISNFRLRGEILADPRSCSVSLDQPLDAAINEVVFTADPESLTLWANVPEVQTRRRSGESCAADTDPWVLGSLLIQDLSSVESSVLSTVDVAVFDEALSPAQSVHYLRSLESQSKAAASGVIFSQHGPKPWQLRLSDAGVPEICVGGADEAVAAATRSIKESGWTHIGVSVKAGSRVRFFIDGEEAGGSQLASRRIVFFPREGGVLGSGDHGQELCALMRDVSVHQDPPTKEEFGKLSRGVAEDELGALEAHWPLGGKGNRVVPDSAGNGYLGIRNGVFSQQLGGFTAAAFLGRSAIDIPRYQPPGPSNVPRESEERTLYLPEIFRLLTRQGDYAETSLQSKQVLRIENEGLRVSLRRHWYKSEYFRGDRGAGLLREGLGMTLDSLSRVAQLCRSAAVDLVVLLIPEREFIYLDHARPLLEKRVASSLEEGWHWHRIEEFCNQRGIAVIALGPILREAARKGAQLNFKQDGHLNVAGHQLATEHLLEKLTDWGLCERR